MIDTATRSILANVLRRESRSLLQYLRDAYPWAPPGEEPHLDRLRHLAEEAEQSLAPLARFLLRQRVPLPSLGGYPETFTSLNFVRLDHLCSRVIEDEERSLAELERDIEQLANADAQRLLKDLAANKRQRLRELQRLRAAPSLQEAGTP